MLLSLEVRQRKRRVTCASIAIFTCERKLNGEELFPITGLKPSANANHVRKYHNWTSDARIHSDNDAKRTLIRSLAPRLVSKTGEVHKLDKLDCLFTRNRPAVITTSRTL